MNKILIIAIILICFSCTRKTEFLKSKAIWGLFLIKNHSKKRKQFTNVDFYRYSRNTKYFLYHEDPGGFSSEELGNYPEDYLASFIVSKCKNDTTKLVGRFHFYRNRSNLSQLDTIIYKCD